MKRFAILIPILAGLLLGGCGDDPDLALYCGVDQDQSQSIVAEFESSTGLDVAYHGETEAMRSVGLPQRLLQERERPRADVYWSNEILHMVHLTRSGVMDKLPAGLADEFPDAWRDPKGMYVAFGARARVLLVNTELLPDEKDHPKSIADLLDPKYAEMGFVTSMAEPLTGTTYTHAVSLLTKDEAKARAFLEAVAKAGREGKMKVVSSNGRVMKAVRDSAQKVAFGLTDTDDSWIAIEKGFPLKVIYPDQGAGEPGTLLIPNTAALVRGRPNGKVAEKLLRWLVSKENEARLAASSSAQIPLRADVPVPDEKRLKWVPGKDFRTTEVDWNAVGHNADRWRDWLTKLFKPAN